MNRAIYMARRAMGNTSPNPAVGAVIVKDGMIVGEGYTQPPGSAHAEIMALKAAGQAAYGASLYVTLEPCSHFGRTPPCTSAIIEAGIREVHIAVLDPNPLVGGKGKAKLEQSGINTLIGDCAEKATEINEGFFKHIITSRPFVTAKWAMSLDGKIATRSGDSKWITGRTSRAYAHYLRAISDAVIVGIGTVLADDPQLTIRIPDDCSANDTPAEVWPDAPRQPLRVVLDSTGRIPLNTKILDISIAPSMVVTTSRIDPDIEKAIETRGVELIKADDGTGRVDLDALLRILGARGITNVLLEGGGEVFAAALSANLVDKVCAFIAPKIIGGEHAPSPVRGIGPERMTEITQLRDITVNMIENDTLITGYITARR